ncbi:MAG: hypothetical protein JW993_11590 [Sedimentisphaerales bacterium]|nr:hypothetical protein [Sedimentisphaerales bacterium]
MSRTENTTRGPAAPHTNTIAGVLAAAVNMEEDIGNGVYRDYLRREHWPDRLTEEAFAEIRKRLTVLIEGTERHKRTIGALVREHGRDR